MWAIRQKSTGWFLPKYRTTQRSGGTWLEPTPDCIPRMFTTPGAAKCALHYWLTGQLKVTHGDMYFNSNGDPSWDWTPVPDRKASDMEVVEIEWKVKGE